MTLASVFMTGLHYPLPLPTWENTNNSAIRSFTNLDILSFIGFAILSGANGKLSISLLLKLRQLERAINQ